MSAADQNLEIADCLMKWWKSSSEWPGKMVMASLDLARAAQTYWYGLSRYLNQFMAPAFLALPSFQETEKDKWGGLPPWQHLRDYLALWHFNQMVAQQGWQQGLSVMREHHLREMREAMSAWVNTLLHREGEDLAQFSARQAQLMDLLVHAYPKAIQAIEPEYGLHFDDGGYIKAAETDRFILYQVLPRDKGVEVRPQGKPILIIPPYVLGANIMAFLPGEHRSYVHCFANQGIPTYIRIVKDIETSEAVQVMTGEDDCRDTRALCQEIQKRHGRPVTLSGYCQGGFTAVVNYLSGELDGLVDALNTCVAPMDGTRSPGLVEFLKLVPERFREVGYAVKTLPNGNQVVDGRLMSWVFKLKSMDRENPVTAFHRDLVLLSRGRKISKSAAAINYWLLYDITDLPLQITRMSFDSYTIPVSPDGTLPVKLFGRNLNFNRIKEKGIPWQICVAEQDDLVEKESALAPLDWVEAEVAIFPKGHAAIATSWSLPTSECSLHCRFDKYRGPVHYQLDLEATLAPVAPDSPPETTPSPPLKRV